MKSIEVKGFKTPDEVRTFEKGKVELIKIGGSMIGKATFEPGWTWSKCVKPIAKTDSCEVAHFHYQVSGILHVVTDDGIEKDVKPGEILKIGPGHNAWVVGNEPVVTIDFQGMADYAKKSAGKK
ncbi:MAG: cupin domain-containing protein [Nanoarchaeota archaeon]